MTLTALELPMWRDWAPTEFDAHGIGAERKEDRREWRVLRMRTRDSEDHEDRNFERAVDSLRAAGDAHYDVIRHTHWAVGWVEFIVFDPESSAVVEIVNKMIRRRKSEEE